MADSDDEVDYEEVDYEAVDYEEVDIDGDGVKPVWSNWDKKNSTESIPRPQAIMANILKGDISSSIQGLKSLMSPPAGPAPKPPPADTPPDLPPPNTKKIRPLAPPPTYLKTHSSTMDSIPQIPGTEAKKIGFKLEDSFIIEKEEYSPKELVGRFSDRFPLHVHISKGFYGTSDTRSVSKGDIFNIHFVKKTKVVDIEDGFGHSFKVALNSAIQFGLIYNPNNKRDEALKGYMFNKVSDLLPLSTLPKVMRASVGWGSGSAKSMVENHELFIVKGWKSKLQKKFLKVYNPVSKMKKKLPENCECKFCTTPYDNRLYLMDIVEHVQQPFPCSAVLYMNADKIINLTSSVVTLKGTSIDVTLVASGAPARMYAGSKKGAALEIPCDLDIEFQVMYPKKQRDTDQLYQTTRNLLEEITTSKKKSGYMLHRFDQEKKSEALSALYSIVREGNEMTGVDIVKPAAINTNVPEVLTASYVSPRTHSSTVTPPEGSPFFQSESLYMDIDGSDEMKDREENTTSLSAVETKTSSLATAEETKTKPLSDVVSTNADLIRADDRTIKDVEDEKKDRTVEELRAMVEHLKQTCASLQDKMDSVKHESPSYPIPPTPTTSSVVAPQHDSLQSLTPVASAGGTEESAYRTTDEATQENNRQFLATLDFVQILNLLDAMGLKKHHEAFMEERVNGEILLECDDETLKDELKITSKIQRSRIMKLIQGKYSAKKILEGEDPYVYAQPK